MNDFYRSFVETAKSLAVERGLKWDLPCDDSGKVPKDQAWDLGSLASVVPPPFFRVTDLGFDAPCLVALNSIKERDGLPPLPAAAMPAQWRDFYQAVVLTEILIKRNKPQHALINIGRYVRLLATCVEDRDPWDITGNDVQLAYNIALGIGQSGKIATNFAMLMRVVIDGQHLFDRTPLARFCIPYIPPIVRGMPRLASINSGEWKAPATTSKRSEPNSGNAKPQKNCRRRKLFGS